MGGPGPIPAAPIEAPCRRNVQAIEVETWALERGMPFRPDTFHRPHSGDRGTILRMRCPHCQVAIHRGLKSIEIADEPLVRMADAPHSVLAPHTVWRAGHQRCPECHGSIIVLVRVVAHDVGVQGCIPRTKLLLAGRPRRCALRPTGRRRGPHPEVASECHSRTGKVRLWPSLRFLRPPASTNTPPKV